MISREEVLQLAELARLQLSEGEVAALQKDVSSILDYVKQVSDISQGDALTPGLSKASPLQPQMRNVMRADTPRLPAQAGLEGDPLANKEEALRSAFPKRDGDFNAVRQIIQKDE